jgi:hypothetical protein
MITLLSFDFSIFKKFKIASTIVSYSLRDGYLNGNHNKNRLDGSSGFRLMVFHIPDVVIDR